MSGKRQRGRTVPTKDEICMNCYNKLIVDHYEDYFYYICRLDGKEHRPYETCDAYEDGNMTVREYLDLYDKFDERTEEETEQLKQYNKELIAKYPWLLPRNRWTGEVVEDYDYTYTELDDMPDGWRIAFSEQMQQEIKEALLAAQEKNPTGGYAERRITTKYDSDRILPYMEGFRIMQIKSKYATLRFYCGGAPEEVFKVISKYENLSSSICEFCGKPAKWISRGWMSNYCDDCALKLFEEEDWGDEKQFNDRFTKIEE